MGAGFGLSVVVASLLNALIVLVKETDHHVMSAFKAALGHHWVTHGAILIVLFIILGFVFTAVDIGKRFTFGTMLKCIVWSVIISSAVIAVFLLPNLKAGG